jgi:hypothetical protein
MGRKSTQLDKRERRYIRIEDRNLWEIIDRLATLDKYKNSFNRLINNALIYGLPKLYEAEFGKSEEELTFSEQTESKDADEIILTIVRLLREVIINEHINKSLICSLFRLREIELEGTTKGLQLSSGHFQNTPDCLVKYEITELKKLRN